MKLIDADELKEIIVGNEEFIDWQKDEIKICIDACDSAYDVEAVVKQIEEFVECNDECSKTFYQGRGCTACVYKKIIEIVRNGGVINGEET